jgi:hypothetical protein
MTHRFAAENLEAAGAQQLLNRLGRRRQRDPRRSRCGTDSRHSEALELHGRRCTGKSHHVEWPIDGLDEPSDDLGVEVAHRVEAVGTGFAIGVEAAPPQSSKRSDFSPMASR